MKIIDNHSLKEFNTFGLDVKAKKIAFLKSEDDIQEIIGQNLLDNSKVLILGGGSNILFQNDFDGVVLKSEIDGINPISSNNGKIILEIGSGVNWDELVQYCVENGYYGIENLSLIPGTVGAAPIQNIGAYGVELEEVFLDLEGIQLADGEKKVFNHSECKFGYRDSIFKSQLKNKYFITKVRLNLDLEPRLKISYRAIKEHLKTNAISEDNLSVADLRSIIIDVRNSKLPDPEKIGNAGSFFKNPVIGASHLEELKLKFKDLVYFKLNSNSFKIPAGWLIEKSGYKGQRTGSVGVHDKQALVLVNHGNGNGSDLVKLADEIKLAILKKFNIDLETEVNIV